MMNTVQRLSLISASLVLVLFCLFFGGSVTPSSGAEVRTPTFGKGTISVRLYTDYFCHPCQEMEPEVESVILELVNKNRINLTFIDTPFSQYSSLYARYYLSGMSNRSEIEQAFATRTALIEAAKKNIGDRAKIEAFLAGKGIKASFIDAKSVFDFYGRMLKEDNVHSTPTCVIERNGKKEKVGGKADILNALRELE